MGFHSGVNAVGVALVLWQCIQVGGYWTLRRIILLPYPFLHISVFRLTMTCFPLRGLVTLQGAVSCSVQWNLWRHVSHVISSTWERWGADCWLTAQGSSYYELPSGSLICLVHLVRRNGRKTESEFRCSQVGSFRRHSQDRGDQNVCIFTAMKMVKAEMWLWLHMTLDCQLSMM